MRREVSCGLNGKGGGARRGSFYGSGRSAGFRKLEALCAAPVAQDRRQTGRQRGSISILEPFDAEDSDVAFREVRDQVRNGGWAQLHGGQVECDGMIGKEAVGSREIGIEVGEPFDDRRLRRKYERHVGSRPEHERLALAGGG